MKTSLGPVLYHWSKTKLQDFYHQAAQSSVDIIYLGETVCAKRRSLNRNEWLEIGNYLTQCGKQVVLSTLTLIEASSELSSVKKWCDDSEYLIEANDLAAVEYRRRQHKNFVCGTSVNIYNAQTLYLLAQQGLTRWVMPVELGQKALSEILTSYQQLPDAPAIETEVFSYGYLPLAYSARCFTARLHDLPKDNCQFICHQDESGIAVNSQQDEIFLRLNGISTQSGKCCDLRNQVDTMRQLNVDIMRFSPLSMATLSLVDEFYTTLVTQSNLKNASIVNSNQTTAQSNCNGYWYGQPGMVYQSDNGALLSTND